MRLLVTRAPNEATPDLWDWSVLLDGGDPLVLHVELVGIETEGDCCG